MNIVIITGLCIGSATVLGAVLGFLLKKMPDKYNDGILGLSGGIMLAASVYSLIIPAIEKNGTYNIWLCATGILLGAVLINLIDKIIPKINKFAKICDNNKGKVILLIIAIAVHNLPEGIAAGVSFGLEDISSAISVAVGIGLQNIPEGMIIIPPMLCIGISKKKSFLFALFTGAIEILGTLIGYFTVSVSKTILPFALSFAGGTMLYIISNEIIPETHKHGNEKLATYSMLSGFVVLTIINYYI